MKIKLLLIAITASSLFACQSTPLTAQVVLDKFALVNSITTLKDQYIETKENISAESGVFSLTEITELKADAQAIESFYMSIRAITDNENSSSVAMGLSTFTSQINTVRGRVTNAATIIAANQSKFKPETQTAFASLIGKYNVISEKLDKQLADGENQAAANTSIDLLNAATPIILQIIAASA